MVDRQGAHLAPLGSNRWRGGPVRRSAPSSARRLGHAGGPMTVPTNARIALADWRRQVAALYASLRADERPGPMRAVAFRSAKDRLFATHPSSPVPEHQRRDFHGLAYSRHDPPPAVRARTPPAPAAPALRHAPVVPRPGAPAARLPRAGLLPPRPAPRRASAHRAGPRGASTRRATLGRGADDAVRADRLGALRHRRKPVPAQRLL